MLNSVAYKDLLGSRDHSWSRVESHDERTLNHTGTQPAIIAEKRRRDSTRDNNTTANPNDCFSRYGIAQEHVKQSAGKFEVTDPGKLPEWTQNWVGIGMRKSDTEFLAAFNESMAKVIGGDKWMAAVEPYGYTKFQLKVGGRPQDDIERIHAVADLLTDDEVLVADANTGWRVDDALRVVNAVRDRDVYIEQPCRSYEHCLTVRHKTALPFILDENITGIDALIRGHTDGAMDVINLKISKVGGLTRARQIRDLCVSFNLPMTIEDSWGGDIITAAIAHLAHSTPEALRFSATDFNSYVTVHNATGAPQRVSGHMAASDEPGLGIEPDMAVLGKAVAEYTG